MSEINVILVDENDNSKGIMPKMEAHEKGVLHRAISIFLFDINGNWILQKRAETKYHSPGLWTNTCCSHPLPNENTNDSAHRRLMEEMGIDCELRKAFTYKYIAKLDNNLIEHELDHVFVGMTQQIPIPNPHEVCDWKKISFENIDQDVKTNPQKYTEWFKLLYNKVNLYISLIKV